MESDLAGGGGNFLGSVFFVVLAVNGGGGCAGCLVGGADYTQNTHMTMDGMTRVLAFLHTSPTSHTI